MSETTEKVANEDKRIGVCKIKSEYIIEDHIRLSNDNNSLCNENEISEKNGNKHELSESIEDGVPLAKKAKREDKKEKLRGQNKSRPPPFKASRKDSLCPWLVDQTKDELEKQCINKKCIFMHNRVEYLKIKPSDIGENCYLFEMSGKCLRGVTCRMGSKHLTPEGYNIIDKQKFEASQKKPSSVKNQISKVLQEKLRKFKYNFTKAENVVKMNAPSKKETKVEGKNKGPVVKEEVTNDLKCKKDRENKTEQKESTESKKMIGTILDTEEIKLRTSEKKIIDWKDKIMLSPLTTVGNLPFRRICKEYGADITCGEMALAPRILKGAQEEWALIKRHESENVFGVQICGNNPGVLTRCAQLLNQEADVDFIDLNLGCPIDLIYKQGAGCGMLNRLNVLESVVKSTAQVLDVPFTVKTRTGIYMDKPIAHNLMPKFRDWGVSMINIHGRSREQRYTKLADWEYIEKCAQAASSVPVYGTGDVLSYDDYTKIRKNYTSVAGISIGRGALIKPWIFQEIKERKLIDISSNERFDMVKKYVKYGLEHWGSDTRGVETTRRFLLEWISFLHRYVPVGILEHPPQRMNERPPYYKGRDDLETLMTSSNCADWIKISEMLLGKVPDGFHFLPKHKANAWR